MGRVTLKGLLAHKLRLALTAIAIVLGVTFISGTFILTDTLHNTFDTLFSNIYQNVDFQVRGVAQFTNGMGQTTRNPIPESVLPLVRGVPGVETAAGTVQGFAQFVGHDGKAISTGGAPNLGVSFDPDQRISVLRLAQGSAPTTPHEVVMDEGTAQKYDFRVGQPVRVLLRQSSQTFTISGIARFGTANNLAGATIAAFDLPTAQTVLDKVGKFDAVDVVAQPGADKSVVQRDIARVLPHGVEVVTGQTVANEASNSINQALSFFSTALLVFAFIALFVGAFTILNTFSIIVGQRTRELALLRIVGASRRQVFRSVLAEAAIVGLVSSLVGIGLGVLSAIGLEALLRGFGIDLPTGAPVFEPRTVIVALIVGVGVTVVAAISPARRAVRIPPVAAISDQQTDGDVSFRRRFTWGASLVLLGALLLGIGLAKPAIQLVGLGAVGLFVGVAMLSPAVARPLSSAIGRPLARWLGVSGRLGRENSMRSPRRTAQTASALMVGLALVSAIAVFGASLSRSATSSVNNAIVADLIVTNVNNTGSGQFSNSVAQSAAAVPGVSATTTVYADQFEFRGGLQTLTAVSTPNLSDTIIFRMNAGNTDSLATGGLLIDSTTANNDHLSVGDTAPVRFALTGMTTMRIGGIYQPNALIGHYVVGAAYFLTHFESPSPCCSRPTAALRCRTG
jgi:putative ABC transport system permease protein